MCFPTPLNLRKIQAAGLDFSRARWWIPRSRKVGAVFAEWKQSMRSREQNFHRMGVGPSLAPIWAPAEIGQKTTNFAQSEKIAKLMNNKEKVLVSNPIHRLQIIPDT